MADEGISAGSVWVEVKPRVDQSAFQRLGADPAAAKVGDDLGDRIGKAISKRIATAISDGVEAGGKGLGGEATRQGTEYGGKFADGLKAKLAAALRSLPPVKVDADSSDADRKIAELRTRIEALRDKKVGVDIDAGKALAEVSAIKAELDALGAKNPNIQVSVDAGAAAAELAAVSAEADHVGASGASAALAAVSAEADHVGASGASAASGMGLLISAGLALGPAIIPAAAAAAGAILAIGSAATSAFAGIAVGALAFHGIADAVKGLDTAQQQAAKTGNTIAAQQKSLAGGADQVRSDEASLANTRANAGDAARRSGQQIADAERSLAAAQQDAIRAQRTLNEARAKEVQDQQDLTQSLKQNALDQRQAVLDVAAARTRLAQTGSEADRIAYEEAVLRQDNLRISGKRLADQQTQNVKTGVDGSKQVVTAQQGVVQAQQRVAAAERAVTDARAQAASQARQSAQAIAQASQAVITAQRGIGAAAVAAGATGGAAIDALGVSMANLPQSGQVFARFLYGLKGNLTDLQTAAADGILPGAQAGIQTLLPYLGSLRDFVGSVATEIGALEVRAAHTFTNPFWRQFFGFIASEAVPNLNLLYTAGVNVAEGFARIVQAFAPVERQVGGGFTTLTDKFVAFSRSLDSNQGFQQFVQYVQAEGPHVVATISALAQAGLRIAAAYGPVGSVVVTELQLLGRVINAIPVPVITALAFALTAYKTAALLSAGITGVLDSKIVGAIGKMVTYKTVTTAAGEATTGFQRATTGVSSFLGGPFGILLGVGALAISYFAGQADAAKQKTDEMRDAAEQYGRTLKDGITPESAASAEQILRQNEALAGLVRTSAAAGISSKTLVDAINGDATARQTVVDSLNRQIDAEKLAASEARGGSDAETVASKAHLDRAASLETMRNGLSKASTAAQNSLDLTDQLTTSTENVTAALQSVNKVLGEGGDSAAEFASGLDLINALTDDAAAKAGAFGLVADQVANSNLNAGDETKAFGQVLADLGSSATTSGPVFNGLATAFNAIAVSSVNAHDKAALLKQTLDQMYGAAISQTEATEAQVQTMGALTTQLGGNSAGFDLNNAKTAANTTAIVGNRNALQAALVASREKYVQDIANGVGEDVARAAHDKTIKSITDGIPPTQRQTTTVKGLVAEYGAIPSKASTAVSAPGLDAAIDELVTAHAVQFGLNQSPPWTRDQIAAEVGYLQAKLAGGGARLFKAAGGAVRGPGTGTSDSIPAMLSNDEHVLTADEVHAAGGHQNIYTLRAAIKDGSLKGVLPGFAAGGPVGKWPINIPTNTRAAKVLADLWAQWNAAVAAQSAIGTAGGDTGSADLGIAKTIADVAHGLKADHKVLLSAFETALVESGMRNLKYGDRDSLGVFQQRPSQGWGSAAEVLNVAHAARSYLTRAIANEPRYAKGTAGQLAQSVQRSAFPGRYDQRASQAEAIIGALSGGGTAAGFGVSAGGNAAIKAFIRSTDPLPYVFGAAGPRAYDCSGISSAVYGLVTGRGGGHGQRYFTTFDFASGAPAGFKPGPGGTFTVGVNPTTHMAGNYGGLGFEAASTKSGIKIGPAAKKTATFQKQFHMSAGGPVDPDLLEKLGLDIGGDPSGMTVNGRKVFDTGGMLPPGLSIADNRTGTPEAILTDSQWSTMMKLAANGAQPPNVTVHSYLDGREIAAHTEVVVDRRMDRVAASVGSGVRDM